MTERTVEHAAFTIERDYDFAPAEVFAAFADPAAKRRWFGEGEGWSLDSYALDFRVGGRESASFRSKEGMRFENETVYLDIVPERRIVFAYSMAGGPRASGPFSASLATIMLEPHGAGTKLVFTEHAAFFEGADGPAMREAGWRELLGRLEAELRGVAA